MLAGKASTQKAARYEHVLADCLKIVDEISSRDVALQVLGQAFVRMADHATNKEKQTREGIERTIPEIQSLFFQCICDLVGKTITF